MPQPFTLQPGQQITGSWQSLYRRQECATGIAAVANAWAEVDSQITTIFSSIMGDIEMTPTDAGISLHIKLDKLASATMEALESLSIKMDVIQAGLALRLPKEKLEEFVVVRKILRKAAGQRATVVHACWGVTDAKPDDLILMGYRGENTAYTVQDFKDIAVRIDAAKLELMKFAESCHFALGKVPPPERP